ncbi:MAG: hypothetical protein JNK02_09800 [Planctomycetes bacterium]|nr:hypothetical protein [Planctomycetota bacterium]
MLRFATSLAARQGTLWIARWDGEWRVVPCDFDGRQLAPGFVIPPESGARAEVTSIAVDEDRRVWVVDHAAGRVRAFTAFGRELAGLPRGADDRAGSLADPVALDVCGVEDAARLVVASGGARRHALHVVRADARAAVALRPRDAEQGFPGLGRVAFGPGGLLFACEPASGLVLVWRDGQFHFAFRPPQGGTPRAVRALADGRIVVATADESGGALELLDPAGRLLRTIARGGGACAGELQEPEDLALDASGGSDRRVRVVVADLSGVRLSVWNLEGDCYGAFEAEPGRAAEGS